MYEIKQSAAETIPFFVHDANGDAVTGLADGSFTKRISKGSGAFAAMTVTISEMENGWYSIPLSATHSNTLGLLTIVFTNAGAKQVNLQWRVEAKLIDDLNDVAATDIVSAGAITTSSGAVSTVTTVGTTTTNTDMRGTDSALLAASAPTNFGDLAITVTTGQVTVGTNNDKTGYSISGTITTLDGLENVAATDIVSAGAITTLSGAVANVDLVDTTTVNTDMRGTDSALLAASAPTNFSDLSITVTTGRVSVGTSFDKTGYSISGTITTLDGLNNYDPTTDTVLLDATATSPQLVDDILDEVNTGATHNVTNSLGKQVRESAAVLVTESGTAQAGAAGTITLSAGSNANDDFYNDMRVVIVGGAGVGQARVVHDYNGTTKVAEIAPDWVTVTDVTSEYQIQSQSNVHVHELEPNALMQILADSTPFNGADIPAILADSNELQGDWADGGRLDTILDARMAEASISTTGGAVDTVTTLTGHTAQTGDSFARIGADGAALTDLGGMSTGMKAEVNTEMVDVMDTDTITLPGQTAPPLAPTHRQAIGWLFKSYRNKETQTATEYSLFDDAGTTVDAKATVSDDSTTFTKEEIGTGP